MALSTCNRTEIYAAASDAAAEEALAATLVAHSHISDDELACARYVLRDERAATQLFRVASSLDSMVVGESEIQGQVRQAWEIAAQEGTAGAILNQLFRQALEVGKQVRASDPHRRRARRRCRPWPSSWPRRCSTTCPGARCW